MSTSDNSTLIDETVIDGLRPQAHRYDVDLGDGLVLSVLPNGSRTWTWVYSGPGRPHRRTLGIYPDMSLKGARAALAAALDAHQRERDAPPAYVIRDGRIRRSVDLDWKWPVAGGIAVIAVGCAVSWWLLRGATATDPAPAEAPHTLTLETRLDSRPRTDAAAAMPAVAANSAQTAENRSSDPVAPQATVAGDPVGSAVQQSPAVPSAPLSVSAPPRDDAGSATVPGDRPEPSDQNPPGPEAEGRSSIQPASPTPAALPRSRPGELAERPVATNRPPDSVIGTRVDRAAFTAAIHDPRVARAQLTSEVVNREPVDQLGPTVVGNGEDLQDLYFFTELQHLGGQQIRHRWLAGDRIQAEVAFNIGEAWRWRVFSRKRMLASLAGEWRIQVLLDDDSVIYDAAFEFVP